MLDEQFLHRLDAFALAMRTQARGGAGGLRRSKALGSSVEFSDFRTYSPGDDLRRVDWNAYARFDKLFLKLFLEEQEVCLHLLLDASASMAEGTPGKWALAQKLTAALAYLSLMRYDRVRILLLQGDRVAQSPLFSGRQAYPQVVSYLLAAQPVGVTRLSDALTRAPLAAGRGMCVLVSDLLCEAGWERGASSLLYRRQEVSVLQVLSPEEMDPTLSGAVRLIDCEGETPRDVQITPETLRNYHRALDTFLRDQQAFCHGHGMPYLCLRSDMDFERDVLKTLAQYGVIASR